VRGASAAGGAWQQEHAIDAARGWSRPGAAGAATGERAAHTWPVAPLPLISMGLKLVMVVPREAPGVPAGTASGIASEPAMAVAPLMVEDTATVPQAAMGSSVEPPACSIAGEPASRVATRLIAPG
jgi:hypothetical protein